MTYFHDSAASRVPFIGRSRLISELREIMMASQPQITLVEGYAGVGKTTILERAAILSEELENVTVPIIDFYNTDVHSFQGIERAIADALTSVLGGGFAEYDEARQQDHQADLWTLFKQNYEGAIADKRVLLRFDTVERLAYERDPEPILQDCQVEELGAPSWWWLLQRVGHLPNTSVLLAARPTPEKLLRNSLNKAYDNRVRYFEVGGFDITEMRDYFRATEYGRQVVEESPHMLEKIHLLSEGRPILIALALDWLKRGMIDVRIYEQEINELRQIKTRPSNGSQLTPPTQDWEEIRRHFEKSLIEQIRRLDTPQDVAVRQIALCRKGCAAELLARLMDIPLFSANELAQELEKLSFVKRPRSGTRSMLFLHDEMYDLIEKHVWQPDYPDYSEQIRCEEIIINWYDHKINQKREETRKCDDWRQRNRLRREEQLLLTEQLYYRFDSNPRLGYRAYLRMEEDAISSRELEWDVWLRNEAMWFMSNRAWRRGTVANTDPQYPKRDPVWISQGRVVRSPAVDYDSRRWWINRYIAYGQLEKATEIATRLLDNEVSDDEPELYRGGLRIALATAQALMGGEATDESLTNLEEAIDLLKSLPDERQGDWLHNFLLGTAKLYQGIAFRNLLRIDESARAYGEAIRLFRKAEARASEAEALNNLAYIYARRAKLSWARDRCREALEIRREIGDVYPIALSLNTMGVIEERRDRPEEAIKFSEEALKLFESIGNVRGVILAEINLGRAFRRKARSMDWSDPQQDFEMGETYLRRAISHQEHQGQNADLFYKVEAHNELGCLFRDWAATRHNDPDAPKDVIADLLEKAEQHLRQALDLTGGKSAVERRQIVQYIDSLEDLARVCYWRIQLDNADPKTPHREASNTDTMEALLQEAAHIALRYTEEWPESLLIAGKVYFQHARLALLRGGPKSLEAAAEFYVWAAGYAQSFSRTTPELQKILGEIVSWLCKQTPEQAQHLTHVMSDFVYQYSPKLPVDELIDAINTDVYNRLQVSWPKSGQEVNRE